MRKRRTRGTRRYKNGEERGTELLAIFMQDLRTEMNFSHSSSSEDARARAWPRGGRVEEVEQKWQASGIGEGMWHFIHEGAGPRWTPSTNAKKEST